jgi:hypothetical protein
MKKKLLTFAIIIFIGGNLFSKEFNLNNIFSIDIPENMVVVSLDQSFSFNHNYNDVQYKWTLGFMCLYDSKFIPLKIELFGDKNPADAADSLHFPLDKIIGFRGNNYGLSDQVKFLFEKFEDSPEYTSSKIPYSMVISSWPAGSQHDYLGIYFKVNDDYFSECIISVWNSWRELQGISDLEIPENDFYQVLIKEEENIQAYYNNFHEMVDSLVLSREDGIFINAQYNELLATSRKGFFSPNRQDIKIRIDSNLESENLGILKEKPYRIMYVGLEDTINGLDGNWVYLVNYYYHSIGWVFDRNLHRSTQEEIDLFGEY